MSFDKIKNLIKQNGNKFIFVENGEPEVVVMSFQEYQNLVQRDPNIRMSRTSPNEVRPDIQGSRLSANEESVIAETPQFGDNGIPATDNRPLSSRTVAGRPNDPNIFSHHSDNSDDKFGSFGSRQESLDSVGLPVRLEDIRLEDLPI